MKNKLIFEDFSLTDENIYGGVQYEKDINPDIDLTVGNVACARIEFTTDSLSLSSIGLEFEYQKQSVNDSSFVSIGHFVVTEAEKNQNGRYRIEAYDVISYFDVNFKDFTINYPITVGNLFKYLCEHCVPHLSTDSSRYTFTNSTIAIPQDVFGGDYVSCRSMLGYIASVAGGYIQEVPLSGTNCDIRVKQFSNTVSQAITGTKYTSLLYADYNAQQITKVQVAMEDNDIGIIVGSGNSTLFIRYNPIFYNDDTPTATQYVQNIYDVVSLYDEYVPMKVTLLEDWGINTGDTITVDSKKMFVFKKKMENSGVTLECTGGPSRKDNTDLVNEEMQALVGKYNKLSRTVDATVNEVGNLATGLSHTVRIAADGVTVTNQDGDTLVINGGCVDASTIDTTDLNMSGRIAWTDLTNGAQTYISNAIAAAAGYKQDYVPTNPVEGDSWYVTGNQDITQGGVTYYHHYTYYYNGTSWDTIALPAYIKSTYLDFSQVVSPKIIGQDIDLQGGTFNIKDLTGAYQYGFLGYGSGIAGSSTIKNGVVLSYSDDSSLNFGDYYVICAEDGIRLCANDYALVVNSSGVYTQVNGGSLVPITSAVFG